MTLIAERRVFLKYLGAGFAGCVANAVNPLGATSRPRPATF